MKKAFSMVPALIIAALLGTGTGAFASIPETGARQNAHTSAIELLKQSDFEKVIQLEKNVLAKDPADLTAYFLLSIAYLGLDDEVKALEQAETVKKIDSMFASEIYGSMGRYFITKKRYHKALHYLNESAKINEDPDVVTHIASIYMNQGLLDKARTYYEKLLKTKPDYVALGRICLAQGEFECAVAYGKKAVKEDFKSPPGYLLLSTGYLLTGKNELARINLLVLRDLSPEFFLTGYFLGVVELADEDYDAALLEFSRTMAVSPKFIDAYLMSAVAWHIKGNLSMAKEAVRKATEIDPLDTASRVVLGNILLTEKDYKKADEEYRKAADIFPDAAVQGFKASDFFKDADRNLPAYLSLSVLYSRAGLHRQATSVFNGHSDTEPFANPLILSTMAKAEQKLGNNRLAEELLLAAAGKGKNLISPHIELGGLYEAEGKSAEAVKHVSKAAALAPDMADLKVRLGDLHKANNEPGKASGYYREAIEISPESVLVYNKLARLLADREMGEDALQYAAKGAVINPEDVEMKDTLGWILFKLGRYEESLAAYSALSGRDYRNPVIYYHIGMVHLQLGNIEEAVSSFEKALNIKDEFMGSDEAKKNLWRLSGMG